MKAKDGIREEYSYWQKAKNTFFEGIDKNKTLPDWAKADLKGLVVEHFRTIGHTIATYELLFLRMFQQPPTKNESPDTIK